MLTFLGTGQSCCDCISRRSFLQVGSLAVGGLAHQDTVDLKSSASTEVRGEFNPISRLL